MSTTLYENSEKFSSGRSLNVICGCPCSVTPCCVEPSFETIETPELFTPWLSTTVAFAWMPNPLQMPGNLSKNVWYDTSMPLTLAPSALVGPVTLTLRVMPFDGFVKA
jgi:hypothetical protein